MILRNSICIIIIVVRSLAGELKQQFQCGGWVTPVIGLEPVPLPHTDRRADENGEEGSPRIDDVCRRHCTVRRQGSAHDGVLGDVEESSGREWNASLSTEDPVH